MNSLPVHPVAETLSIPGPVGELEALLESPPDADNARVVVVCHPHPVYGGTMTNKVVHMLARSCNEFGVTALRFNYRGVGKSPGSYDEGNGETQDALAVLDWAANRWPQAQLWLAGFSFGGAVAIRAAVRRDVKRLITVAPAVHRIAVDSNQLPRCPWLLVQGDRDELVDAAAVQQWVQTLATPPQLELLAGVDHFFHGRLNQLRELVLKWLRGDAGRT
jgi:alpha/beta superfamily hydrolase